MSTSQRTLASTVTLLTRFGSGGCPAGATLAENLGIASLRSSLPAAVADQTTARRFSSTPAPEDGHAPAVFVDKTTKVITQGFTGKNGTFHSQQVRRHCRLAARCSLLLCSLLAAALDDPTTHHVVINHHTR